MNLKSTNRNINVLYSIKMKIESKLRRLCHLVSMVCFKILWCIWKYEYIVFLNENLEKGFDNMATRDFSLFFAIHRNIIIISIQKKLIIRYFILQTENWSHLNSCFDSTDTRSYERMNNFLFLKIIFLRGIGWKWKYHYYTKTTRPGIKNIKIFYLTCIIFLFQIIWNLCNMIR